LPDLIAVRARPGTQSPVLVVHDARLRWQAQLSILSLKSYPDWSMFVEQYARLLLLCM
jgi:hypothetical protein